MFELDSWLNGRGDAFIVGPDGKGLRNLTFRPAEPGVSEAFADPVWSPDGTTILVLHGVFRDDGSYTGGLSTIRPDGSNMRFLQSDMDFEHQPDWGPHGGSRPRRPPAPRRVGDRLDQGRRGDDGAARVDPRPAAA